MDRHPLPPPDLHRLSLHVAEVETTTALWRVYRLARAPVFFGKTGSQRFDDPARGYGVLYAAESLQGTFVESVGWDTRLRAVGWDELAARGMVMLRPKRRLRLFELDGPALRKMGADARLATGDDFEVSRAWSAALHGHPAEVDGLRYRARHDPKELSLALFNRCSGQLEELDRWKLADPRRAEALGELLDHYGMGVL